MDNIPNISSADDSDDVRFTKNLELVLFQRHLAEAEDGDAGAMTSVGMHYAYGTGVDQDGEEAIRWLRKAVDLGNVEAMGCLAAMYAEGEAVTQDHKEAFVWWRKAADLGGGMRRICSGACTPRVWESTRMMRKLPSGGEKLLVCDMVMRWSSSGLCTGGVTAHILRR